MHTPSNILRDFYAASSEFRSYASVPVLPAPIGAVDSVAILAKDETYAVQDMKDRQVSGMAMVRGDRMVYAKDAIGDLFN